MKEIQEDGVDGCIADGQLQDGAIEQALAKASWAKLLSRTNLQKWIYVHCLNGFSKSQPGRIGQTHWNLARWGVAKHHGAFP